MKKIFSELIASFRTTDVKSDAISFSMQMGAVLLNLLVNLFLTNVMPQDEYGAFAYASTLIFVLAGLGTFGTLNLITREVGASAENFSTSKTLFGWAAKRSIIFTAILLSAFILISLKFEIFFGDPKMEAYRTPFLVSLAAVPFLVLVYICQAYFQGLRKIFNALFAEKIVRPVLLLLISLLYFFLTAKTNLNFIALSILNLASFAAAMFVVFVPARNSLKNIQPALLSGDLSLRWKKSTMTFFLLSAVTLIYLRADIICLGFFKDTSQIGVYNIACRIAEMSSFPLHVLTFGLSPLIASVYNKGENVKLQEIITASSRLIFILCFIPAIIFFIAGKPILGLFGSEFEAGFTPFIILVFGNMLNAIAGPAGYVLIMTGHERLAFLSMTIACIVNIGMNLILVPLYGITGTAIALCCAIFTWNVLITIFTIRKTGIRPDIFFLLRRNES